MLNPATETSPEDYVKCSHCGRQRCEHHYGVDGRGSGFTFQSSNLFCPGSAATFTPNR